MALQVGELFALLTMDSSQFNQSMTQAQRSMTNVGGKMKDVGKTMSLAITTPLVAMGYGMVKTMTTFDDQMAQVKAISGETGDKLLELRDKAKEMGAKTQFSATEAAQAMTFLAQAGWGADQILKGMPHVLSLAAAGALDLASAADIGSSVMAGFGLGADEAQRMADVLAMAANATNSSVQDLGETMKYTGPIAKQFGMSLEQTAGIAGLMANAGIKGSEAGTAMRAALTRLAAPPKQAADALYKLGVATIDTKGNMLPIATILDQLRDKFGKLSDSERLSSAQHIFGMEAMSGWLSVLGTAPGSVEDLTKALENSKGSAQEAQKIMEDSLGGSFRNLSSAVEGLVLSFEDIMIPILRAAADKLSELSGWFAGMSDGIKIAALVFGVLAAAAGPILIILGTLISSIGTISTAFAAVSAAITAAGGATAILGGVFAALTGPIALIVAAVVGLGVAFVALYKKNDEFRAYVQKVWEQIKSMFASAMAFIKDIVMQAFGGIMSFVRDILDKLKTFWKENGDQIVAATKVVWAYIEFEIKSKFAIIKGIFDMVFPLIVAAVKLSWMTIKMLFMTALDIILGVIKVFAKVLTGDWKGAWDAIVQIFKDIWKDIKKIAGDVNLEKIGKDIVNGLIKGITGMVDGVKNAAKGMAKSIKNTITDFFDIHSPSRLMMTTGGQIVEGVAIGMEKKTDKAKKAAKATAKKIKDTFNEEFDKVKDNYKLGKLDVTEYIAALNKVKDAHSKNASHVRTIELEIQKAMKSTTEAAKKAAADRFAAQKASIDNAVQYEGMTLVTQLNSWTNVMNQYKKGTAERIEAERKVMDIKQQIYTQLKQLDDDYLKSVQDVNAKLIADIKAVNDAYDKALQDRTTSLTNFAGLFDEIKTSDVTGGDLLKNLQDQVNVFQDWQKNLDSLKGRGLDAGLFDELQNMGPQAASQIAALTTLTDEQLGQYAELWRQKHKLAAEQAAKELEPLRAQTTKQIQELQKQAAKDLDELKAAWIKKTTEIRTGVEGAFNPMKANLTQIGTNAMAGLMAGLKSMEGPLKAQAAAIAASIQTEMKKALQIKSPSRVMAAIGRYVGEGLVVGMDDTTDIIASAAASMAVAATPDINPAVYPEATMGGPTGFIGQALSDLKTMLSGNLTMATPDGGPTVLVQVTGNNFADGTDAGNKIKDALRRIGL